MATDPEFKSVTLAFSTAAKAEACVKKLQDYGYSREPIKMSTPKSLSFTYKATLEKEVMAIVQDHGGYVPAKPTPLWPGAHGSHTGRVRDRN